MRKILVFLLVIISFSASAQRIQKITNYGYAYNRLGADTLFYLPSDTFSVPAFYQDFPFLANKSNTVYIWNTSTFKWEALSTGGGGSYTFPYSVVAPGNAIQLENDTTATPANYFYGFNSAGRRTWLPQSSITGTKWGLTDAKDYTTTFNHRVFTDSILVNNLLSSTVHFDNGLVVNADYGAGVGHSKLTLYRYGFLANTDWSQKITFQILDSSTNILIGVGSAITQTTGAAYTFSYISGNVGDTTSLLYNVCNTVSVNKSGLLFNVGDIIELTLNQRLDSAVVKFKNLTNGDYRELTRYQLSTTSGSSARSGYPEIFIKKGHFRLLDYSIHTKEYNHYYIGNSISAGHAASKFDTGYVARLITKSKATSANMSKSSMTSNDFLRATTELNIRNKVVFLNGLMRNAAPAGQTYDQAKYYYDSLVARLRAKGNTIVHIDIPYTLAYMGSQTWEYMHHLNKYLDTAYGSIDRVVHVDTLTAAMIAADNIHPNDEGHTVMYNSIVRNLPEYFGLSSANTAEMNSIYNPFDGQQIYNTDSLSLCYFNGSVWLKMSDGDDVPGIDDVLAVGQNLTTNRIVNLSGNSLRFQNTGTDIYFNNSDGIIVTNGTGGQALNLTVDADPAGTDFAVANFYRSSISTPTSGIGSKLRFYVETDASLQLSGELINKWSTVTNETRTSQWDLKGVNSAATETFANFQTGGIVRVNNLADTLATKAYARSVGGGGGGTPSLTQYRIAVGDASNQLSDAAAITGNRALISDANGVPTHSATTATELGYVSGATSNLQTQISNNWNQSLNSVSGLGGIGTSNSRGLRFYTNNTLRGQFDSLGRFNINVAPGHFSAPLIHADNYTSGTGGLTARFNTGQNLSGGVQVATMGGGSTISLGWSGSFPYNNELNFSNSQSNSNVISSSHYLELKSALKYTSTTITGNTSLTHTSMSLIYVDATSGNVTVTLPAASTITPGVTWRIVRIDNSGNTITVAAAGSDTINGAASKTIVNQYDAAIVQGRSSTTWVGVLEAAW